MIKKKILRDIIALSLSSIMLIMVLSGCRGNKLELIELINNNPELELNLRKENNIELLGIEPIYLQWKQLDKLDNYEEFRKEFDKIFYITTSNFRGEEGKNGCIYIDKDGYRIGNSTLENAYRNEYFNYYMNDEETLNKLLEAIKKNFKDVENLSKESLIACGINTYFNIFIDNEYPDSYNGNQELTREQFMAGLYRATNEVNTEYLYKDGYDIENDPYIKSVGNSIYAMQAKQMNEFSWLQYENKSLDSDNIDKPISRIEAIYMVVKKEFKDLYNNYDVKKKTIYKDVKNGNDYTNNNANGERDKEAWQKYVLAMLFDNHNHGIHSELYKAVGVASDLELIQPDKNGELRWDEAITKDEAIQLIMRTEEVKAEIYGTWTKEHYGIDNGEYTNILGGSGKTENGLAIEEVFIMENGKVGGVLSNGQPFSEENKTENEISIEEYNSLLDSGKSVDKIGNLQYNRLENISNKDYREKYLEGTSKILEKENKDGLNKIVERYSYVYNEYKDEYNEKDSLIIALALCELENQNLNNIELNYIASSLVNKIIK